MRCLGLSLQWLPLLQSWALGHPGFSSCDAWAQLPHGMWGLLQPGIKLMLPALADGFLTTGPPEKSPRNFYIVRIMHDKKVSLYKLCNLKKLEKREIPTWLP